MKIKFSIMVKKILQQMFFLKKKRKLQLKKTPDSMTYELYAPARTQTSNVHAFHFGASMDLFYFVKEPGIKAGYDNCWLQE